MDAPSKPIVTPTSLADALVCMADVLRDELSSGGISAVEFLCEIGDAPLSDAIRTQLRSTSPARFAAAAQLAAFAMLLAARDGRLEAITKRLEPSHPARAMIDLLALADLDDVLDQVRREFACLDPMAQFHELYLRAADAPLRRGRGVFYTPRPIVDWMLRSIEHRVQCCFPDLNALRWIDPACGSGAFLAGVIDHHASRRTQLDADSLVGFEVLPATQAVAQTLLGRRLGPGQQHALRLECVNPLTAGETLAPRVLGEGDALPVILGNPPYANFGRQNKGAWIDRLLRDYKVGLNERKLNLDDDFIKFLRWGQFWIERAGRGVLAMITSRTYLDGLTHRVMRRSLAGAFDEIYLLDLGGDVDARLDARSRTDDENVFGIRRGVAIGVFVKTGSSCEAAHVRYHALRGSREEKFAALDNGDLETTPWRTLAASAPHHDFVPRRPPSDEYHNWPRLDEIFPEYISGVQTKNDAILTDLRRETLAVRMTALLDGRPLDSIADEHERMLLDRARAKFADRLSTLSFDEGRLREYLVAPFDRRWIYYEPRLVGRARLATMRHLLRPNLALVFMRQSTCDGPYDHFLATDMLASDRVFYSTHGAPFVAPLWLYGQPNEGDPCARRPNLSQDFAEQFARRLKLNYRPTATVAKDEPRDAIGPEDIFHYLYATFFRGEFRHRYEDQLRVDFPRIPPIDDPKRFHRLRTLGCRLIAVHLARSTDVQFAEISKSPAEETPLEVRQWRVGGYAVLPRWLRKRRRQKSSRSEQVAEAHLIDTILASLRLIREIDAVG
ncbi:MAG: type ISP restriction/modification enzyme [Pirellulaceae bacterium]